MTEPLTHARALVLARRYADRFVPSRARLLAWLARKVEAAARVPGHAPAPALDLGAIADQLEREGRLDDGRWAQARAEGLLAAGRAPRRVRAELARAGIAEEAARVALAQATAGQDQPELLAALVFARRRRLGPYARDAVARAARATRDLAALARQGFGYETCRRVLELEDAAAADALAASLLQPPGA